MLLGKRWSLWRRLAAMIAGTVVVAGALSACELSVPNVVGLALPEAVSKLEGSGYRHVAVVDEFGTTIEESHYEDGFKVTAQDAVGEGVSTSSTITLTVAESAVASLVMTPDESPSATPEPEATPKPEVTPEPEPASEEPAEASDAPAVEEEPAPPAPAPQPVRAPTQMYSSCAQARAAGAAPLYEGDPGYNPRLDRDKDGVACE
ncbi:excalibur calcium-binding domain-containing protein [Actinomyces sp.]|uniref:excalibur calcium-binding domain-containing protein n=1 Tax=Actinomyces sp. TaxID=29317 RepID=UPI0025C4ED9A|nr:excalibur calcium-binding domain-containing protein [Actinomyces sp.]